MVWVFAFSLSVFPCVIADLVEKEKDKHVSKRTHTVLLVIFCH